MNHQFGTLLRSGLGSGLRWGLVAAIAVTPLALAQRSVAQERVTSETAEETVWGQESRDPFSTEGGGASGILELMQQLNRAPGQSWAEFRASQQENLNSAANDFRSRQLQLLKGQQPIAPNAEAGAAPAVQNESQSSEPTQVYPALW